MLSLQHNLNKLFSPHLIWKQFLQENKHIDFYFLYSVHKQEGKKV